MKRRIDYEREPPRKAIRANVDQEYLPAIAVRLDACEGGVLTLAVFTAALTSPVGVAMDSPEKADELIASLISARNKIWPTA